MQQVNWAETLNQALVSDAWSVFRDTVTELVKEYVQSAA
jgi:hypothetical protein